MLSDLAFALAARGHKIQVIASRLTYEGDRRLPPREVIENVTAKRVLTTGFGRAKLFGRAVDCLTFYLSAALLLAKDAKRGDIVIVKTDPPLLSVLADPVALMKGARIINWLQDLFPEVATNLGVGTARTQRWAVSLLRKLRDVSLRRADMNVVLGKRMADRVRACGVVEQRVKIIANWADGREIKPVAPAQNSLRKEWGLDRAFVVGYSGNLGRAHDFETFLTAIVHLEAQQKAAPHDDAQGLPSAPHPSIRWLFIGSGAQMRPLKNAVHERGLTSVLFRAYQPQERLSESLSAADAHLISLKPNLEGLIVPSKYYGVAAAGRPAIFVGDPDGELARIIKESDTGLVVREGDGVGLAEAIQKLATDPELAIRQGARARRLFDGAYDLRHAISAWEALLHELSPDASLREGGRASTVANRTGWAVS